LIILDEPFSGLDATTVQLFTTALVEASRSGTTILFSSHILEQAEKICHSLCLIHRGTTVLEGKMEEIKRRESTNLIEIEFGGDRNLLHQLPGVQEVRDWGRVATLLLDPGTDPQSILEAIIHQGRVHRFGIREPSLNDIFLSTVGAESPSDPEPEDA
jgi:ABC-2 type transport system ATP-binding protein